MIRKKSKEPHNRYPKGTKPRVVPLQSEEDRIDEEKSLLGYMSNKGSLLQASQAQLLKARSMYVFKGCNIQQIAKELSVDTKLLQNWILHYGWEEKRKERQFNAFLDIQETFKKRGLNLDARHDGLAHSIENLLEEAIHKHADPNEEFELEVKDLNVLAKTLQTLQQTRRLAHDRSTSKAEHTGSMTFDTSEGMDNMVNMISALTGGGSNTPLLEDENLKLTVIQEATDAEFEVIEVEDKPEEQD